MSNLDKTAIPINDQKHNDDLENNNQNVNVESYPIPQNRVILLGIDNSDHIKSVIYSRAKVVKFLTIIDGFFLTLNFIISIVNRNLFWLFFFLLPLCFAGYKGAKEYKKNYLLAHLNKVEGDCDDRAVLQKLMESFLYPFFLNFLQ